MGAKEKLYEANEAAGRIVRRAYNAIGQLNSDIGEKVFGAGPSRLPYPEEKEEKTTSFTDAVENSLGTKNQGPERTIEVRRARPVDEKTGKPGKMKLDAAEAKLFRQLHGSDFDANSSMDAAKLANIQKLLADKENSKLKVAEFAKRAYALDAKHA